LEEIAGEIKSAEKKNRDLYNSAIDIEDEELSIRTQNESAKAIRNMRGLKSAMDTFKAELEKSGILEKSESGKSVASDEDDSGEEEESYKGKSGDVVYISNEHSPIVIPADKSEKDDSDDDDDIPEKIEDVIRTESSALSEVEPEEMKTVESIVSALSKAIDEINDDDTSGDAPSSDKSDDSDALDNADDDIEIEKDDATDDLHDDELAEMLVDLDELEDMDDVHGFDDDIKLDELDELSELSDELDSLADELEAEELEALADEVEAEEIMSNSSEDFGYDFDSGIVFDEIEFAEPEEAGKEPEEAGKESEEPQRQPLPVIEPTFVSEPEAVEAEQVTVEPTVETVSEPEPAPEPKSDDTGAEDNFSGFAATGGDVVGIYSSRTPAGFSMFSRGVDVSDWTDMLIKVCEILILKNPYTVAQFDKYHDLNPLGNCYFSYNQGDIKGQAKKLSNGLWVEINRTPDDIVMLCKKVLELCGYPRSELEIEFAD
jgi:hypothetical protein